MPKYHLNALGDVEFEKMVQSLLKCVIGPGTTTFGAGKDGAREATYQGAAPYPSKVECWDGDWIFQAKFHDTELIGIGPARASIITDVNSELKKITTKYKYKVENYILITNVPLSGVHAQGTIDRLESEVFSKYRDKIPHLKVWGADDVNRFLDLYPDVRRPYLPLLITGDIIAELLTQAEKTRSERTTTVDMYLRTTLSREENAQLDQAGDVSEDAVPLQHVFFDLDAYLPSVTHDAMNRLRNNPRVTGSLPLRENARVPMVNYLIGINAPDRTVIVGGPGEGKSTIGQYLAQLHRAVLLGMADDIAISPEYVPETPRIPFRIVLKDFAQWLSDNSTESSEAASLDAYISQQVTRLSTRAFNEKDLHEILKTDPGVLILDGLDEVTDASVRRRLVLRLHEFLDRCQNTLHSNLQVIATTRPTNYGDQFDPKTFLHFRLRKLKAVQVRDYVKRWTSARVLEEDKAMRLQNTIEECIADNQISLLMTTPLQVTILILIINSGGTPPRQREALFNEYLEVIYKREKAKGLGIVKTEKELLIGLHKFVGYLLHEEATKARTSSATLGRTSYDSIVMNYLRRYDPYSPSDQINDEWHAITVDAGERLVLIVESPANVFGFELRSIQEFFAACYLSDTSSNTKQRFERFVRIAYLPHWRNVALFFAGRVGRNYSGEAAYIIEMCKQIDRDGPDLFVRRGAEVALELAAERALGPDRVLQRSLLEYGLGIFDAAISAETRAAAIELVERLPYEDIRDHVLPILAQRLSTLGYVAIINACYLLESTAPQSEVLAQNLIRVASEAGPKFRSELLEIITSVDIPGELRMQVVHILLASGVEPSIIGEELGFSDWPALCSIAAELYRSDLDPQVLQSFAFRLTITASYASRAAIDSPGPVDPDIPLMVLLQCAKALGILTAYRTFPLSSTGLSRFQELRRVLSDDLPDAIKSGTLTDLVSLNKSCWLPWLAHLTLGNVTVESWESFREWLTATDGLGPQATSAWMFLSRGITPIASVMDADSDYSDLSGLTESAITFGGMTGVGEWLSRSESFQAQLGWMDATQMAKLRAYSPGAMPPEIRSRVLAELDSRFDSCLQPIVLEWLDGPHHGSILSSEEFDFLSEWFAGLPSNSPWRRHSLASRATATAIELGRIRSPEFRPFISVLDRFSMLNLIANSATSMNDEDLIFALSVLSSLDSSVSYENLGILIPPERRRKTILRLLPFADDASGESRERALELISAICRRTSREEGPQTAIRSHQLDEIQNRLISSQDQLPRTTGIALFGVRPPRSKNDWKKIKSLLKSATADEVRSHWSWVLRSGVEIATDPSLWARSITSILQDGGMEDGLKVILADVLRGILSRESQSLSQVTSELSLPVVDTQPL